MIVASLLIALVGCNKGSDVECDDQTACAIGSSCVYGKCVENHCSSSSQCPMESYCSDGECVVGCQNDGDCKTGYHCNLDAQSCDPNKCTDTQIDCGFREFCNQGTGQCYDAGDLYCRFCNEDSECGDGNICFAHYCGVDCSGGRECPAGFECEGLTDQSGNVVAYQCITYCDLYDGYDPGSFLKAPKLPTTMPIDTKVLPPPASAQGATP